MSPVRTPVELELLSGFEPETSSLPRKCSTPELKQRDPRERGPAGPLPSNEGGAGDGNRTHVTSLEGWGSTIELHPPRRSSCGLEGIEATEVLVGRRGFEPLKAEPMDLQSIPVGHLGISPRSRRLTASDPASELLKEHSRHRFPPPRGGGASEGTRTLDRPLTRRKLYQLSYASSRRSAEKGRT